MRTPSLFTIIIVIFISCSTESSLPHSEVVHKNHFIYNPTDTLNPYNGRVEGYVNEQKIKFTYWVKDGIINNDILFHDDKGTLIPPKNYDVLKTPTERESDELIYQPNSDIPFTGCFLKTFKNGKMYLKGFCIEGKQYGTTRNWDKRGRLESESRWWNGKHDSQTFVYDEDGDISYTIDWNYYSDREN
jgi:hypothetical protein